MDVAFILNERLLCLEYKINNNMHVVIKLLLIATPLILNFRYSEREEVGMERWRRSFILRTYKQMLRIIESSLGIDQRAMLDSH